MLIVQINLTQLIKRTFFETGFAINNNPPLKTKTVMHGQICG